MQDMSAAMYKCSALIQSSFEPSEIKVSSKRHAGVGGGGSGDCSPPIFC